MAQDLKEKDDIMSDLMVKFGSLEQEQKRQGRDIKIINKSVVELKETVADLSYSTLANLGEIKLTVSGNEENHIDGMYQKLNNLKTTVESHDEAVQDIDMLKTKVNEQERSHKIVMGAVSNWKFLAGMLAVFGIGSISDLINLIEKLRGVAENQKVQELVGKVIVRAFN